MPIRISAKKFCWKENFPNDVLCSWKDERNFRNAQMKELANGGRWRIVKCEMNGWYFVIREPKYHSIFLVIVSLLIFFFVESFCRMSVCAQHFIFCWKRNETNTARAIAIIIIITIRLQIYFAWCFCAQCIHTRAHELIGAAILLSTQFDSISKRNEWKSNYTEKYGIEWKQVRCSSDRRSACLLVWLYLE